ncbi:kinase [Hirsutella rhossiliensis]|uniref:non-specific serine/threonine protein kinase n=1 Tax=Hirsutella rhossiliensis TaxID=111463 RepID=A0A9P8MVY0_9HYPO|nr:kinase [Hirsutella rhossiliensis]KAH0962260.1 kinase [Hirsutella rhossiliensis]
MAVKVLWAPPRNSGKFDKFYLKLKREVETMAHLHHPHIINMIASKGWDSEAPMIFMGLKDGTVTQLFESDRPPDTTTAYLIIHHVLQALDYLAIKNLVHRDVKPDNIFFDKMGQRGQFCFVLSDFGLSNNAIQAETPAGSPLFMAPEMLTSNDQTSKVDVWSLFVTMLWILDIEGFRNVSTVLSGKGKTVQQFVCEMSQYPSISGISEMVRDNPVERASAAHMLVKCFDGDGLSTPRRKIKALPTPTQSVAGQSQVVAASAAGSQYSMADQSQRQPGYSEKMDWLPSVAAAVQPERANFTDKC